MTEVLARIRAGLPTHIPLTRHVHCWKEGDEVLGARVATGELAWIDPVASIIGKIIKGSSPVRRPIPDDVLDNQAWQIATLQMDETEKIRTFGETIYRKMAFSGNTYLKWLKEQIEAT
jgi:hypothetical protein